MKKYLLISLTLLSILASVPKTLAFLWGGISHNVVADTTIPVVTITAPTLSSTGPITDTTIRATDNASILASGVTVSGSATPTNLNCIQTSSIQVDCTVRITTSGTLLANATDVAGNPATQASQSGYSITGDTTIPVVTITSPTLTSTTGPITDTTIRATDNNSILASGVTVSGSASPSNFNCTQTSSTQVDCTVIVNTSGILLADAVDVSGNHATQAARPGYSISGGSDPVIVINAPTTSSNAPITDTTVRVTDNVGIDARDYSVGGGMYFDSSNPYPQNINCIQTTSKQVDCTLTIPSTGTLAVWAVNTSGRWNNGGAFAITQDYTVELAPPVITITAPTLVSGVPITDTTIHVTDDAAILTSAVSVSGSATPTNLNCTQTTGRQVNCTVTITTSGTLLVDATDVSGKAATQKSQAGYVFETVPPTVSITPSTTTSSNFITDTTIRATDNIKINASDVHVSGSAHPTNLNCTQTSTTQVDCTVLIQTSGTLLADAKDVASNSATQASRSGYTVTGTHSLIGDESGAQYVGIGCTTTFFIDKDCDSRGVGRKSSGIYTIGSWEGGDPDTVGDLPDADDMDPTVNTPAEWRAKWGSDNAGMVNFLQQRKGFWNTSRIWYVDKTLGNDSTGVMNDPAHPFATSMPASNILLDLQGGAIIFRGGEYSNSEFYVKPYGYVWSGSTGHPLYIMSYPGEQVTVRAKDIGCGYSFFPSRVCGNFTMDGFAFRSPLHNQESAIGDNYDYYITYRNLEQTGYNLDLFNNNSWWMLFQGNVYHDYLEHPIYTGWSNASCVPNRLSDMSIDWTTTFAQKLQYPTPNCGAQMVNAHMRALGNVFYNNGANGYDTLHINTYGYDFYIGGNIVTYSGGQSITFQTGIEYSAMVNDVHFDVVGDGILFNIYTYNCDANDPGGSINNNIIMNNSFHIGKYNDYIKGGNVPNGGLLVHNGTSCNPLNFVTAGNSFNNNILNVYGGTYNIPINMWHQSTPSSNELKNNIIWTNGSTPSPSTTVLSVCCGAGGTIPEGNYPFSALNGLASGWSGNLLANPLYVSTPSCVGPPSDCGTSSWTPTPGKFNLAVQSGSPARDAGVTPNAPRIDVRGVLRPNPPNPPSIGAYEYHADTGPTPVVELLADSRGIEGGQSTHLTWKSLNATSCTGIGFSTGGAIEGSVIVTPSVTTNYAVTCSGPGGSGGTYDVTVDVLPIAEAPTLTLTNSIGGPLPTTATPGSSLDVYWHTTAGSATIPYACDRIFVGITYPITSGYGMSDGYTHTEAINSSFTATIASSGSTIIKVACGNLAGHVRYVSWQVN